MTGHTAISHRLLICELASCPSSFRWPYFQARTVLPRCQKHQRSLGANFVLQLKGCSPARCASRILEFASSAPTIDLLRLTLPSRRPGLSCHRQRWSANSEAPSSASRIQVDDLGLRVPVDITAFTGKGLRCRSLSEHVIGQKGANMGIGQHDAARTYCEIPKGNSHLV